MNRYIPSINDTKTSFFSRDSLGITSIFTAIPAEFSTIIRLLSWQHLQSTLSQPNFDEHQKQPDFLDGKKANGI